MADFQIAGGNHRPVVPPLPEGWRLTRDGRYLCVHSQYRMVASVGPEGSVLVGDLYLMDGAGLVAALAHALAEVTRG